VDRAIRGGGEVGVAQLQDGESHASIEPGDPWSGPLFQHGGQVRGTLGR
jgi:hypothetical protein